MRAGVESWRRGTRVWPEAHAARVVGLYGLEGSVAAVAHRAYSAWLRIAPQVLVGLIVLHFAVAWACGRLSEEASMKMQKAKYVLEWLKDVANGPPEDDGLRGLGPSKHCIGFSTNPACLF